MSVEIFNIKISCRTENSEHVFYMTLYDKRYFKAVYHYELCKEDEVEKVKSISRLTTKQITDYFDKVKENEDIKYFEITDYLISAKYKVKEYESFKRAVVDTMREVKKILRRQN